MSVIDDIAFQTNILALNPTAEALETKTGHLVAEMLDSKTRAAASVSNKSLTVSKKVTSSEVKCVKSPRWKYL